MLGQHINDCSEDSESSCGVKGELICFRFPCAPGNEGVCVDEESADLGTPRCGGEVHKEVVAGNLPPARSHQSHLSCSFSEIAHFSWSACLHI